MTVRRPSAAHRADCFMYQWLTVSRCSWRLPARCADRRPPRRFRPPVFCYVGNPCGASPLRRCSKARVPMPQSARPAVLDLIGNTPLVEVTRIDTGPCRLFLKLESQNPGGSIKDRIGLSMIEAAEHDHVLGPDGVVVEATAGNTGLGLALVARAKGYRVVLVVPDKMSSEKVLHLKALGAEVHTTRSDVGKGHPAYYQDYAARLARELPGAFFADQFNNPNNPLAHERTTGPEIWAQMGQDVDAIVCGVGSAGTITGLTRFFRGVHPAARIRAGRSGRLRGGRLRSHRHVRRGRFVGGRGHRRGFHSAHRRSFGGQARLHHSGRRELRVRAHAVARRRHPRRIVDRNAAGRRIALLSRAAQREARRDFRLRHRNALPVEGLQRSMDDRSGVAPTPGSTATCAISSAAASRRAPSSA